MANDIPFIGNRIMSLLRKAAQKRPIQSKKMLNPLNRLSDRQLAEVYFRLEKGQAINHIRRVIVTDWRIARDVHWLSMDGYLKRFKEDTLTPVKKALVEAKPKQKEEIERNVKRIVEELDGLGSLRWLITEEMDRVEMWRMREKTAKLPLDGTNRVIKDLGELLEKYLRLEIDLGVIEPKESKLSLLLKEKFMYILDQTVQNSGKNLLSATEAFLIEAEKEAISFEKGVDGEYVKSNQKEKEQN